MLNAQVMSRKLNVSSAWADENCSAQSNETRFKSKLESVLEGFQSHQLADLDKANLMDRVDVKFMLPTSMLPLLLEQLHNHYSILEINGKRVSAYYNQYFDTQGMGFYHDHHNGKLNRFKVRQRTYLDTDTRFLEVKFKNNQKRTIKTRVHCDRFAKQSDGCEAFIQQSMNRPFDDLVISQQGGYQRIALANEASAERLTLDFNLWFQADKGSTKVNLPSFFIAELKQHKRSKRSPFYQLMSQNNIFPASFSKYCIGCALLYKSSIKTNQFKATLGQIEKFSSIHYPHVQLSN